MVIKLQDYNSISKIIASNPLENKTDATKIVIRPISLRGKLVMQAESFVGKQVFHTNLTCAELPNFVENKLEWCFKQVVVQTSVADYTYLFNKDKYTMLTKKHDVCKVVVGGNDKVKNYLLNEGDNIPVLVDLGIFTKDFKIVRSMFDKFKQINKFVEILDDVFSQYEGDTITLMDFGCGKSYLTFVAYYYFATIRKINCKIIGYDLKKDVVNNCNALAMKYGYKDLHFVTADVTKDVLSNEHIDAVISLHACDIATDYALYYAITHKVKYIFSVPCCQHQLNSQITTGGDLDILLQYGVVKERVCALLTDSIRANILQDCGYKVDCMEFVDLAHSPKNIMLRCAFVGKRTSSNKSLVDNLITKYNIKQELYELVYNNK